MLTSPSLEKALAKYSSWPDQEVASRLALFAPLLRCAAQIEKSLSVQIPVWSEKAVQEARQGGTPLFQTGWVDIDPQIFETHVRTMAQAFLDAVQLPADLDQLCRAVDWSQYCGAELMVLAAKDPMQYVAAAEALTDNDDLLDLYVLPILGVSLRAHLDQAAQQASELLAQTQEDTSHFDKPLQCPVCGSSPALAAVCETPTHGSVKKLYCATCGGHWLFERIRCAACGQTAVSELQYVHEQSDPAHRLHVCETCHSAVPTVFAGDAETMNADVEQIILGGLENAYWQEMQAESAEPQSKDA